MLHLYWGDGKGKTTAAMGLALRALGHGRRVVILQFLKDGSSGEIEMLRRCGAAVYACPNAKFTWLMTDAERAEARRTNTRTLQTILQGSFDLLVLDEACAACKNDLVEEALLRDQVDCAFVTAPSREEFILYPLYKDRLMAVMDSGCPLSSKARLTAQDLKDLPYIVPAEGTNYDAGKLFLSAGVTPTVRCNAGDDYAAAAMARKGLGFTILPELLLQDILPGGLRTIPLAGSERRICMAVNRYRYRSPALQSFVSFVQETVPKLMSHQ